MDKFRIVLHQLWPVCQFEQLQEFAKNRNLNKFIIQTSAPRSLQNHPMSSQDSQSSTHRPNFQAEYNKIKQTHLTTIQALHAVFRHHKSIDKLNQVLTQIGKSQTDLSLIEWARKAGKGQFFELCEEVYDIMENKQLESRREIGEMNEEILKMQKSLTGMGIRFSSNELEDKTGENDEQSPIKEIAYQELENDEINSSAQEKKQQNEQKIDESVSEAQESVEKKTIQGDKTSLKDEQVDNSRMEQKERRFEKERKQKEEEVQQIEEKGGSYGEEKGKHDTGIRERIESHKQQIISKTNKIRHQFQTIGLNQSQELPKSQLYTFDAKVKKTQPDSSEIKKKLQSKLNLKESLKDYEQREKNKQGQTKWTELLIQNKSFAKIPTNFDKPKRQRSKYDPYKEISKYESRKKQKCDEPPKNELESLHQKYRKKLRELFPYFVKQMKSLTFTFDGYPNSLDINSFSSFMKHFSFNGICKAKDVLKYFKSCAVNGTWLNEDGFLAVNAKIFDLPQHFPTVIDQMILQKQKLSQLVKQFEQEEKSMNEFENDMNFESKRNMRQKQLNDMDQQIQRKESELLAKLKKINSLLPTKEVNRLIGKTNHKEKTAEFHNYDPERLKKIVESHSGIYQQDIIERLHERKRQNERKNDLKAKKLLQKYRMKGDQKYEGEVRGLKKNIYSAPNIHKVEGYSKINQIKKGNLQPKDIDTIQRSRLRTEPKYQMLKSQTDIENGEAKDHENAKKIEVYRELSLPKLPKRQMRDQSIYEALNKIDTRAEVQLIKSLITDCDEKILEEFESKQKIISAKEKKNPKPTNQQRMKFT